MPWTKIVESDMSEYKAVTDSNIMSVGVVGPLGRGPVGRAVKLTSAAQFVSIFGARSENIGRATWTAVNRLLASRMPVVLVRIAGSGAAKATANASTSGEATTAFSITATSEGLWGNALKFSITEVSGNTGVLTIYRDNTSMETVTISTLAADPNYIGKITLKNVVLLDLGTGEARTLAEVASTALAGGQDGAALSDTDYANNLLRFEDRFLNNIFFVTVFENQTAAIQTSLVQTAENRLSTTALLAAPVGNNAASTLAWFSGGGEGGPVSPITSSYAAAFAPWRYINDGSGKVLMSPVLFYLEAVARSVSAGNPIWVAVAGVKRGGVVNVSDPEFPVGENILALWQPEGEGTSVNPIIDSSSVGPVIYGNRTLQPVLTSLRSLNVRCAVNYIKNVILDVCMGLTFDQNETALWEQFKGLVGNALIDMKNRKGLYDFEIQMDTGTVSPNDIDALRVPGMVRVSPVRPGEYFDIGFVVTSSGATFTSEDAV